ncbi:HD domain-containing protein [Crassaminicella indica]|uniref:HD domain-containing protein n=1 Tax=Crassaminicella indica TaxID=2855394 RepID=A0ABX8RJM8_9CLOT|nr:HD domain-containing protein [Crassaminicella indica]QXM07101.1 HD domain-containing protein [Crassaminicella indica]
MSESVQSIKTSVKGEELEKRENKYICEWGTKYNEKNLDKEKDSNEETNRTYFRRQRDRILYTGGFRRLQDKTQVIAATKTGDHRTRLTHSLEVEQIAISMADALGLNRHLVAAISLGHDVGHTPFGHAVEKFLNEKLKEKGGFSHAVQSVRYLKDRKVKLSKEVFEGILKHDTDVYAGGYNKKQFDCTEYNPLEPGNLEAQVVYWADKIAYLSHDFEDFYKTEIYENAIKNDKKLETKLKETLAELIPAKKDKILEDINNFKTRDLIRNVLSNLIDESLKTLNELKGSTTLDQKTIKEKTKERILEIEKNLEIDGLKIGKIEERMSDIEGNSQMAEDEKKAEIKNMKKKIKKIKKKAYQKGLIINFEDKYSKSYSALRDILNEHYVMSSEVQKSDKKAVRIVEALYNKFITNIEELPVNFQNRIKSDTSKKERIVADYIASMSDRYAEEVYDNLNSIGSYYKY